jgi:N-acetylneuraminic acid mutarotase
VGFQNTIWDALEFGPSDALEYVSCGTDPSLDLGNEMSVSGWVRGDAGSTSGVERVIAAKWGRKADFTAGWETFTAPVGRAGFAGAAFDGRYVYFVPFEDGTGQHADVLRYDTRAPFVGGGSWQSFDAGSVISGVTLAGFTGAVFDGTYLYFPNASGDGHVLRYDTTQSFTASGSWTAYDPGDHGVGTFPKGYFGAVFDGRYIYFSPSQNVFGPHGEVLRYDTVSPFHTASSWSAVNPSQLGVNQNANSDPTGYRGGIFDGQYVYFVPFATSGGPHGEVLRYDTESSFFSVSSWASYDPGWSATPVGLDPDGYSGAAFDGQYIYFVPHFNGTQNHGEVLRYDVNAAFTIPTSWTTFDPGTPVNSPWDSGPVLMTTPRQNLGAVLANDGFDDLIFAIGGRFGSTSLNVVETYDPATDTWPIPATPYSPMNTARYDFGIAVHNGLIYVFGGSTDVTRISTVEEYDPVNNTWDAFKTSMATARSGLACATVSGKIYAIGGTDGTSLVATVEEYDPTGDSWISLNATQDLPTPREGLAAAAVGGKIYVCGGYNGSYLTTLEIYDPNTGWTTGRPMPSPRADFGLVPVDVDPGTGTTIHLFAVGGRNASNTLSSVDEYDPATDRWLNQTAMPTARFGLGCAPVTVGQRDKIYALGGSSTNGNENEEYDPDLEGVGSNPAGYQGAVFDGRYVTFIPHYRGDSYHGEALRYDTTGTFADRASWAAYDNLFSGRGYMGAAFDGRWIYFAPANSSDIARYDTLGGEGSYKLSYSRNGQDGGLAGSPFGITAVINANSGICSVSANRSLPTGTWHHAAMSFDGSTLNLYVDGVLAGSAQAAGTIVTSSAELRLGSHTGRALPDFRGALDDLRIHGRALSAAEILAQAQRRKWTSPEPVAVVSGPEEKR